MDLSEFSISEMLDLSKTNYSSLFQNLKFPWEVLPLIKEKFDVLVRSLNFAEYNRIKDGVYVHKSVTVLKSVYLGRNIIIGKDCDVRNSAFLRENVIIGDNCVIGNSCEFKNCLLFNNVQVPHFSYVGDSVLGYKSHLGAGAITSNLKLDNSTVKLSIDDKIFDTKLRKFGAILGDNVQVGCNSVLNPGTVIGRNTNIYPLSSVRGLIKDNSIYKSSENIIQRS